MPSAVTDKQYGERELLNIFHLNSFTQNGYISPTIYLPRMVTSNSVSGTQVPCLLPSAVTDKQYMGQRAVQFILQSFFHAE